MTKKYILVLIIMAFILNACKFNRPYEPVDGIYRINLRASISGEEVDAEFSNHLIGAALYNELSWVLESARLKDPGYELEVKAGDSVFMVSDYYYTDPSFINLFQLQMLRGRAFSNELNDHYSLILTEESAQKYFGNEDPIGQTLILGEQELEHRVVGVVKGFPEDFFLHFDFLGSLATTNAADETSWLSNSVQTYIRLEYGVDPKMIESHFPRLVAENMGPQLENILGLTFEDFLGSGNSYDYYLQSLEDIISGPERETRMAPWGGFPLQ